MDRKEQRTKPQHTLASSYSLYVLSTRMDTSFLALWLVKEITNATGVEVYSEK